MTCLPCHSEDTATGESVGSLGGSPRDLVVLTSDLGLSVVWNKLWR